MSQAWRIAPEERAKPISMIRPRSDVEREMQRFFEGETRKLETEHAGMKHGLGKALLGQEIDLRRRRLEQWKKDPCGMPEDKFASVKDYSNIIL